MNTLMQIIVQGLMCYKLQVMMFQVSSMRRNNLRSQAQGLNVSNESLKLLSSGLEPYRLQDTWDDQLQDLMLQA